MIIRIERRLLTDGSDVYDVVLGNLTRLHAVDAGNAYKLADKLAQVITEHATDSVEIMEAVG